jgi:large subunit ribosomal protein L21
MSYAIFKAAGHQFRAEKGLVLRVPLITGDPGSKVTFDEVLLSSDGEKVHTGGPLVKGAKVVAEIVRHGKADKIIVYKFKRRRNYRRKQGHRQQFTEVKVTDVKIG